MAPGGSPKDGGTMAEQFAQVHRSDEKKSLEH